MVRLSKPYHDRKKCSSVAFRSKHDHRQRHVLRARPTSRPPIVTVEATKPRVALVGFGEINSPRELIERKLAAAQRALEEAGLQVHLVGPVADDPGREQSAAARAALDRTGFD